MMQLGLTTDIAATGNCYLVDILYWKHTSTFLENGSPTWSLFRENYRVIGDDD